MAEFMQGVTDNQDVIDSQGIGAIASSQLTPTISKNGFQKQKVQAIAAIDYTISNINKF